MSPHEYAHHLSHLEAIRRAALSAADPAACVREHLRAAGRRITAGKHTFTLPANGKLYLTAFGKAAAAMTRAAVEPLSGIPLLGIVAVPESSSGGLPAAVQVIQAGHPLPDGGSLEAGRAVSQLLSRTREHDLVLVLISGGGSALLELPRPSITLAELQQLNRLLIRSGAPIQEINAVRKSISQIKGGGLARMAYPAKALSLILSDVVGGRISMVASGPTVLRRPPAGEAEAVLRRYRLWERVAPSVRQVLGDRREPAAPARRPMNVLIGDNRAVLHAAEQQAQELGFRPRILTTRAEGEARLVGARFARQLLATEPGGCLLMGGETTVTVTGDGLGGRNQEFSLACALGLEGKPGVASMSLATDGVDGPTDAAGAIVSGETIPLVRGLDLSPESFLGRNDAYHLLDQAGALLKIGPTGTNLNDLMVGLRY